MIFHLYFIYFQGGKIVVGYNDEQSFFLFDFFCENIIIIARFNNILFFGNMKDRPKNRKSEYLNLIVELIGNCRQSVINECNKKKINLADEKQVAVYIKSKLKGQSK